MIIRKSQLEIDTMARAGAVVADTLALLEENIQPGATTAELDVLAEEFIRSRGGEPTFKGYKGYPAATCLSPNANFVSVHRGPELKEGMTLAIEPMITAGGPDVYIHDDDWSISTADGSLAAHFEHTVAVTAQGPRILTGKTGVLVP